VSVEPVDPADLHQHRLDQALERPGMQLDEALDEPIQHEGGPTTLVSGDEDPCGDRPDPDDVLDPYVAHR